MTAAEQLAQAAVDFLVERGMPVDEPKMLVEKVRSWSFDGWRAVRDLAELDVPCHAFVCRDALARIEEPQLLDELLRKHRPDHG